MPTTHAPRPANAAVGAGHPLNSLPSSPSIHCLVRCPASAAGRPSRPGCPHPPPPSRPSAHGCQQYAPTTRRGCPWWPGEPTSGPWSLPHGQKRAHAHTKAQAQQRTQRGRRGYVSVGRLPMAGVRQRGPSADGGAVTSPPPEEARPLSGWVDTQAARTSYSPNRCSSFATTQQALDTLLKAPVPVRRKAVLTNSRNCPHTPARPTTHYHHAHDPVRKVRPSPQLHPHPAPRPPPSPFRPTNVLESSPAPPPLAPPTSSSRPDA